jgi:hypothetical protein
VPVACGFDSSARDPTSRRTNVANASSNLLGGSASRLVHIQATRMPRGCLLASGSALGGGETDSTKRRFVLRPTASGPVCCHAGCFALQAKARCGEYEDRDGSPRRHNRGHLVRN